MRGECEFKFYQIESSAFACLRKAQRLPVLAGQAPQADGHTPGREVLRRSRSIGGAH